MGHAQEFHKQNLNELVVGFGEAFTVSRKNIDTLLAGKTLTHY